jgi:hypothetical protein
LVPAGRTERISKSILNSAWIGAFVVTCAVYIWFFGPQTFFALQTRKIGRQIPIVKSTPVELEDLSVAQAKGEKLSFLEASFEVPWDDVVEEKTRIVGNCSLIRFHSGNSVVLCVGQPNEFMNDMFRDKNAEPGLFTRTYGKDVLRSDYTLMKAIYETTPSNINLFTPSSRAAGLASVMVIKALAPPTTDWAIYNVRSKDFWGFQLGNPARQPAKMCLQLYSDDIEFEISLEQEKNGPRPPISQADLNRIIQSAHKADHAQPNLKVYPAG